jgi:hypothetical protein
VQCHEPAVCMAVSVFINCCHYLSGNSNLFGLPLNHMFQTLPEKTIHFRTTWTGFDTCICWNMVLMSVPQHIRTNYLTHVRMLEHGPNVSPTTCTNKLCPMYYTSFCSLVWSLDWSGEETGSEFCNPGSHFWVYCILVSVARCLRFQDVETCIKMDNFWVSISEVPGTK